jgi:thiol-disulfide isomerase/thioredoxin
LQEKLYKDRPGYPARNKPGDDRVKTRAAQAHSTTWRIASIEPGSALSAKHRHVNNALTLGPLALPYTLLLLFAVVASSLFVAERSARKASVVVEPLLWKTLLVGLLVARLAFVWEFRLAYMASPLSMLDIRDGGWNATAGFIGAWLFALSLYGRRQALRKPMQSALLTGSVLWLIGTIALSLRPGPAQEMPALGFLSLQGQTVQLAEFKGKPTVVNLWATWCPPCVREMPVLQQAQRDQPDVNLVFLNQGESSDKVGSWLKARHLTVSNVLLDESRTAGAAFKQSALPMTLFFNARGELVSTRIGELSAATLAQRLEAARQ